MLLQKNCLFFPIINLIKLSLYRHVNCFLKSSRSLVYLPVQLPAVISFHRYKNRTHSITFKSKNIMNNEKFSTSNYMKDWQEQLSFALPLVGTEDNGFVAHFAVRTLSDYIPSWVSSYACSPIFFIIAKQAAIYVNKRVNMNPYL